MSTQVDATGWSPSLMGGVAGDGGAQIFVGAEPWEVALPFGIAIILMGMGAIAMALMTRHMEHVLRERIAGVNEEAKKAGESEFHIPSFLRPGSIASIVEWCSDASQALGLVLAPTIGLSALIVQGSSVLLFGLILLVVLIGFGLFALIHNWKNPTDYMGYAANWERRISKMTGARGVAMWPIGKMLAMPRRLHLTFVNFIGMVINFLFGVVILVVGYWGEIF
ncbi:hypothetical protein [Streptomyces sp. NPDC017993]|uniref:hypothetical protein n=1 Tax=Streptomyces sp. NPDC017993 TaxID=3365027 RepID=UPI003787E1AD